MPQVIHVRIIYFQTLGAYVKKDSHIDKFFAGSGAGITAVTLTYPLDTIRARLAFQVTGEHVYTGVVHTAITIFKDVSDDVTFVVLKIDMSLCILGRRHQSTLPRFLAHNCRHDSLRWFFILHIRIPQVLLDEVHARLLVHKV